MPSLVLEWLNLVFRWAHVIAAIMWIGDSFLFAWLDGSLTPPTRPRSGAVAGELWMVHSGGFYEVVKRKYLAPGELPQTLHWFKWEAYTTWISGFFLLGIAYYFGGGVYLVDRAGSHLGLGPAIALSLSLLASGWFVYDAMWGSALARRPVWTALVSFALVVATAYGLTRVFSGRAAYIHLGAMLGTIMAANVWRRIIPAQRQMLAATRAGEPVDVTLGERAKARSVHNHYLTLPVLFTMLSNHFPSAYGHRLNWLVLVLLVVVGVATKYVMKHRARGNRWVLIGGLVALGAVVTLTLSVPRPAAAERDWSREPPVSFQVVQAILQRRCLSCHAARPSNPSFPEPPAGITFEDPRRVRSLSQRIMVRAVITETMPLGNLTGMTAEERRALGAWIAQGARLDDATPAPEGGQPPR